MADNSSTPKRKTSRQQFGTQQLNEVGKLPPQALELEEAVLGAIMLEKDALINVIDILTPESFYKESHERIFGAIKRLFEKSIAVDILTVTEELKKSGELDIVGGAFFVSQLTNRVASSANAQYHARIVVQKFIQRELIRISAETIKDAYEDTSDVFDLLDKAEASLYTIASTNIRKNYDKMSTLIHKALLEMDQARTKGDGVTGVQSGFTELDRFTAGWQKSDLIIVAARPAMGKTALVLSLARNSAVDHNQPIAIFSLEMSSLQLVTRLIASEAEISAEKIKKGQLKDYEYEQLHTKIKKLAEAPIFIDDTPGLTIFELRAKARRLKQEHNISLIIIDYLQLMHAGTDNNRGNREQEISAISRTLKGLAKELEIPVIALSQLSRAVETRGGDKKPQLSDLRESGAIEQDADMVLFIHRPEYYGILEDEQGKSNLGVAELIIAKHRNGPVGSVRLKFIGELAKFADLEGGDYNYDPAAGLAPSNDFNEFSPPQNTIIRTSKMNNDVEEDPF